MRMWKINPQKLCRKHLLGEHVEMHMFAGSIAKNISIDGYVKKGLVELHNIKKRHDELANEMKIRGYVHKSPLQPGFMKNYKGKNGKVSISKNMKELLRRCKDCRKMIKK